MISVHCLLSGSWTPSGMMSPRAVEGRLREYYSFKIGSTEKNWNKILDGLRNLPDINKSINFSS
jgi:hypothetical protein